jgi:Flp pilus assembly protein TadD
VISKLSRTAALGLGALLLASAAPVSAQSAERPADRLSRHLRELASDPTSLSALIGAGQASLEVGDANAALGFFARADERSSRNGPVKAGLARALLMLGNPREALKMFDAANDLGVPDAQLAADRGLAYDLRGDQRRAQQDYALALTRGADDEVAKRYALSLGISGERDRALQLLDPLLYKRDQGAWRARAFVLAMTGDTANANQIVRQVMPERMAQTMEPFLARLAALNPAQKAAAVHLGEMPSNVRFAARTPQPSATSPAPSPAPESREPRRRPGLPLASPPPQRAASTQPTRTAQVPPAPQPTPTSVATASPPPRTLPAEQRGDLDAIMRQIRASADAPAPAPTPVRVAQAAPAKAKEPAPKPEPKKPPVKKKPEPPKHPARIWVQVAGGANANALPREWSDVTAKAAELKGKGPWTAKNRATNRLLAGPYKSDGEAQAAVARLRKAGIGAFRWNSDDGEAVEKIGAK